MQIVVIYVENHKKRREKLSLFLTFIYEFLGNKQSEVVKKNIRNSSHVYRYYKR
jgi:hypothetical protein